MLESELAAAAAGGVTSLVCPPDTDPPLDEPGLVEMLKFRARKLQPLPAVPARRADARPGRRGADRDGRADRGRLRRLLAGRRADDATRWCCSARCSTPRPSATRCGCGRRTPGSASGVAASGAVATRLGLSGVPVAAETIALHTIFELVRATGARVHLCRLSQRRRRRRCVRARQGRRPAGDGRRQHQLAAPDRRRHRLLQRRHAPDAAAAPAARPRRAARRAGRRHDRRAGVRPQPGRRRREEPAVRRGRAGRHRAGAAAEPGAEVGQRRGLALRARRWRASPASRCACSATRSARWPPAPAGWSKAAWPTSASSTRQPRWQVAPGRAGQPGQAHAVRLRGHAASRCRAACAPRWWPARVAYEARRRLDGRPRALGVRSCARWRLALRCAARAARPGHRGAALSAARRGAAPGAHPLVVGQAAARAGHRAARAGHAPRAGATLLVANHVSWLDIAAIHAVCPQARFVSKADVRPGRCSAGWSARRRHAVHRARTQARRAARGAPDGRGAAGRRHGRGVPRRHHRRRPRAAAVPCQPAAGRDRHRRRRCSRWLLRYTDAGHSASARRSVRSATTTLVQSVWRIACARGVQVRVDVRVLLPAATRACRPARAGRSTCARTIECALVGRTTAISALRP